MSPAASRDDLATKEGAEAFVEALLGHARDFFQKNGWHPMVAHLFCTRNRAGFSFKKSGQIELQVVAPETLPNTAAKDLFAGILEQRIIKFRAIGVVFMSEAWMLETENPHDRHGSLEFHPRRTEGIFVTLEHIRTSGIWQAAITRDANGVGTLGEFRRGVWHEKEGRFANLLHRERFS